VTAPYYADDRVALYLGDFREVLPTLDVQADLIVTDPPYGETSLDWDRWPDGWPAEAAKYARSMWCFGSMRMFLDRRDEFTAWKLSQDVVWEKHNGSGFHADRFRRVHEHALHWYRGDWSTVHHETPTTNDARKRAIKAAPSQQAPHMGTTGRRSYQSEDGGPRLMRSVLHAPSMHMQAINETEKPTGLLEPMVEYGCPRGGLVLDLFAGSSSTLVAARNLGRRAVGIEKREAQCEKAALRLAQDVLDFGESA
jgi:site-specific DNA-methyltransferase (adenine-specific)